MTPIEKAKWLADFWAQIVAGKTAQGRVGEKWNDIPTDKLVGPAGSSNPTQWRIKPEPRRKWEVDDRSVREWTYDKEEADGWKSRGFSVTEWVEVV